MGRVTTYNPSQVNISIGGKLVEGLADDSFVTVEAAGDGVSYVNGVDGEVARSIDPSTIYTVKIALLQASTANSKLQNYFDKDRKDGTGLFELKISDILGNEQFYAKDAWVTKPASWQRGKAQNNREWEIVANGSFTY